MKLYTIGFTKKNAEAFFGLLKKAGITILLDTRLNNVSQLAGYTKKDDLEFFVENILGAKYIHSPKLAPTKQILDDYKNKKISWEQYEVEYNSLLDKRDIKSYFPKLVDIKKETICLLCSEHKADKCHRRLLAEYLEQNLNENVEVIHL